MQAHSMEFVVKEADIDEFNHVNNKVYIDYLETARIKWYQDIGFELEKMLDQGYGDVLRNLNVSYIKEAVLSEKLKIKTFPQSIGNTSIILKQQIYNEQDELITEAEAVIVLVDLNKREKTPIPEKMANKIKQMIAKEVK